MADGNHVLQVMVALAASSAVCVGLWKLVAFLVNRGGSSASGHHSSTSSRSTGTAEREQHIPLPTTSAEAIDWIRKCPESDPYRMLCLHKSATQTDIKKAYVQPSMRSAVYGSNAHIPPSAYLTNSRLPLSKVSAAVPKDAPRQD